MEQTDLIRRARYGPNTILAAGMSRALNTALIEYVALFQQGDETIGARKALLIEQRDQLVERMAEMQRSLDRLNDKIERYDQGLMTKEHLLRHLQSQQSRPD